MALTSYGFLMRIKRTLSIVCACFLLGGCTDAVEVAIVIETDDVVSVYEKTSVAVEDMGYTFSTGSQTNVEHKGYYWDYNGGKLGGYFYVTIYPDKQNQRVVIWFAEVENLEGKFSAHGDRELRRIESRLSALTGGSIRVVTSKNEIDELNDYFWEKFEKSR